MLVEIAAAVPLSETLTYEVPEEFSVQSSAEIIGKRALIPLGRRVVTGYILSEQKIQPTHFTIRKILEIVDECPLFPENCIDFFRWVARYYHHPLGEVIQTALPAGINRASKKVLRLVGGETLSMESFFNELFPKSQPPSWYADIINERQLTAARTKSLLQDPAQKKIIAKLVKNNLVSIGHEIDAERIRKKEEICYSLAFSFDIACDLAIDESPEKQVLHEVQYKIERLTAKRFKLSEVKTLYFLLYLSEKTKNIVPRRELLEKYPGAAGAIKNLLGQHVIDQHMQRVYRNPLGILPENCPPPAHLTQEQQQVFSGLSEKLKTNGYSANLLFGVTGGGKTEIYLRITELCLQMGRDVLVLVPEIALATQLESQFLSRFPGTIALLHSGLSNGERLDQWTLAASGKAKIVIGARSAVFAPLQNLGLIIVDEEHDAGFKQDDGLRYNGRDLAVLRAKMQSCMVVLGSATPSIISFYNAMQKKYALYRIEKRVGESSLPDVRIIDLNAEKKQKKSVLLSDAFVAELSANIANHEQSIVLLNRRGFSTSYICQECGEAVQCRNCNVSLTYHKGKGELRCHYCGYVVTSKLICNACHSDKLVPFGVGTERVEEDIRAKFPDAVIQRLDSDIAVKREEFFSILQRMRNREIDILIGTQMIAKGHHFPGVTFVGVVWADGGLSMPDFKAAERTYQLLSQVTGRAGRGDKKGRVIIQTMRPTHYAIDFARRHLYEKFYEKEITIRERPAFPPFVRLAQVRFSGEIEYDVRKTASNTANCLRAWNSENGSCCEILGPASAPLEKIRNNFRWQILVKSASFAGLHALLTCFEENRRKITVGKVQSSLDVDPENMM